MKVIQKKIKPQLLKKGGPKAGIKISKKSPKHI